MVTLHSAAPRVLRMLYILRDDDTGFRVHPGVDGLIWVKAVHGNNDDESRQLFSGDRVIEVTEIDFLLPGFERKRRLSRTATITTQINNGISSFETSSSNARLSTNDDFYRQQISLEREDEVLLWFLFRVVVVEPHDTNNCKYVIAQEFDERVGNLVGVLRHAHVMEDLGRLLADPMSHSKVAVCIGLQLPMLRVQLDLTMNKNLNKRSMSSDKQGTSNGEINKTTSMDTIDLDIAISKQKLVLLEQRIMNLENLERGSTKPLDNDVLKTCTDTNNHLSTTANNQSTVIGAPVVCRLIEETRPPTNDTIMCQPREDAKNKEFWDDLAKSQTRYESGQRNETATYQLQDSLDTFVSPTFGKVSVVQSRQTLQREGMKNLQVITTFEQSDNEDYDKLRSKLRSKSSDYSIIKKNSKESFFDELTASSRKLDEQTLDRSEQTLSEEDSNKKEDDNLDLRLASSDADLETRWLNLMADTENELMEYTDTSTHREQYIDVGCTVISAGKIESREDDTSDDGSTDSEASDTIEEDDESGRHQANDSHRPIPRPSQCHEIASNTIRGTFSSRVSQRLKEMRRQAVPAPTNESCSLPTKLKTSNYLNCRKVAAFTVSHPKGLPPKAPRRIGGVATSTTCSAARLARTFEERKHMQLTPPQLESYPTFAPMNFTELSAFATLTGNASKHITEQRQKIDPEEHFDDGSSDVTEVIGNKSAGMWTLAAKKAKAKARATGRKVEVRIPTKPADDRNEKACSRPIHRKERDHPTVCLATRALEHGSLHRVSAMKRKSLFRPKAGVSNTTRPATQKLILEKAIKEPPGIAYSTYKANVELRRQVGNVSDKKGSTITTNILDRIAELQRPLVPSISPGVKRAHQKSEKHLNRSSKHDSVVNILTLRSKGTSDAVISSPLHSVPDGEAIIASNPTLVLPGSQGSAFTSVDQTKDTTKGRTPYITKLLGAKQASADIDDLSSIFSDLGSSETISCTESPNRERLDLRAELREVVEEVKVDVNREINYWKEYARTLLPRPPMLEQVHITMEV
jgi:hypothetical protein